MATTASADSATLIKKPTDKGVEDALGIGRGGKKLNTNNLHLQEVLEDYRDKFLEVRTHIGARGIRHDYMREGLLGEIVSRTPIFIYDLPELLDRVKTAFVDRSGKMYIAAPWFEQLVKEQEAGLDSLNFIFRHEGDHLRRLHLARMPDIPHVIANIAQDIRINSDILKSGCAQSYFDRTGQHPTPPQLEQEISDFLGRHETAMSSISAGCGMNMDDFKKYDGLSEEAIGALLMKDWKEPPKLPNTKVPFPDIMEGAAQESDVIKGRVLQQSSKGAKDRSMTPADLSHLASELRRIGAAKANPSKVSDADITGVLDLLDKLAAHPCLKESDAVHERQSMASAGTGVPHLSANTASPYLNALRPSERVALAKQILEQILKPQAGSPMGNKPQDSGVSISDLERSLGRGNPSPSQGSPSDGESSDGGSPGDNDKASQDGTGTENMIPSPNVYGEHDHVMDTEELADLLKKAGLSGSSLEKLGYDDLKKAGEEIAASKDNVVAAINKATEDMTSMGPSYPGGHLVNYAKAQMKDFFKPVLSWEMAYKKILDASGKGSRFDMTEPWMIYHVDAADMGFSSQRDVPYMGSTMPGKEEKPLIFIPIDTSGSVTDGQLKRFVSEAINMARKSSRATSPEVVIVFADTVARGEPVYITEQNYQKFLQTGVNYGGRGGTNLQAGIESIFEMVKPGSKSGYAKRQIDAIVYFTDTYDINPSGPKLLKKAKECGLKSLPTTLFLAPTTCYNESFKKDVAHFAETIFFDPKSLMKIDLKEQNRAQERRNRSLRAA